YLSEQEREALMRHDPMDAFRQGLLRRRVVNQADLAAIDADVKAIADSAAAEAENAPDAKAEDILKHIFKEVPPGRGPSSSASLEGV
ncbi:MAG: hypothetical protein ACHQ7M_03410, partial [Chloroflexota bacterium]